MTTLSARKKNRHRWPALRRRRVAVLFGGPSSERAISIRTAAAVRRALSRMGLSPIALEVSPRVAESLREQRINLAFLTTHGTWAKTVGCKGCWMCWGFLTRAAGFSPARWPCTNRRPNGFFKAPGCPRPGGPWFRQESGSRPAAGVVGCRW